MAKKRLGKMDLFSTPENIQALEAYIASFSDPGERIVATTVMGMTWNLCAELTKEPS